MASQSFDVAAGVELIDVLASNDQAAFATDADHRIAFWNRGAERLFGRTAEEVLGRACYAVVRGRDSHGNRFCGEDCPVRATLRHGETVKGCDLFVPTRSADKKAMSVELLKTPARRPGGGLLVHVLRPIEDDRADEGDALDARPGPPLTDRERQILGYVAAGLQNKEVAQRLGISPATVRNHVHNILEKLEVHSKLEAVSLAFRSGWVEAGAEEPRW